MEDFNTIVQATVARTLQDYWRGTKTVKARSDVFVTRYGHTLKLFSVDRVYLTEYVSSLSYAPPRLRVFSKVRLTDTMRVDLGLSIGMRIPLTMAGSNTPITAPLIGSHGLILSFSLPKAKKLFQYDSGT